MNSILTLFCTEIKMQKHWPMTCVYNMYRLTIIRMTSSARFFLGVGVIAMPLWPIEGIFMAL